MTPTFDDLLQETTGAAIREFRQLGDRLEPLTQHAMTTVRESLILRLGSRLRELEGARDASYRKLERQRAALEASASFRASLRSRQHE